jgi:quinol monooxygenase YgiN
MLYHIVRFTFPSGVDETARAALEADLAALDRHIEVVRWLAVARDLEDPAVTGLLSAFDDEAGLAVYRDHPAHLPVVAAARELCERIDRLDVTAEGGPSA